MVVLSFLNLKDFLNHEVLFKQYPELKNTEVRLKELGENVSAEVTDWIIYFPRDIKTDINWPINNIKEVYLKSDLIHEILEIKNREVK